MSYNFKREAFEKRWKLVEHKIESSLKPTFAMTQVKNQLSVEEFLLLPDRDVIYELIDGEAVPKFKDDAMAPKLFHSLEITPEQIFRQAGIVI